MHAHTPYSRAALHGGGAADHRAGAGGRSGRHARGVAVRPHAHAGCAVRTHPAPHGLHRVGRGRGRPCGAFARCLPGPGACRALPGAHRLPVEGHPARRRRGRRSLRRARAHRPRRAVHHGRFRPRPVALRPPAREPLLGIDHLHGGGGATLRRGARTAGGDGLYQRRCR